MSRFRRGDVILMDITGKMRPWLVVSNNINNYHSEKINVAYVTTRVKKPLPVHTELLYGNLEPSTVCVEEIHTVIPPAHTRIIEHLPRHIMHDISECMRLQLDIENNI